MLIAGGCQCRGLSRGSSPDGAHVVQIQSWFSRLHCLVVGSGLGRDPVLLDIAEGVIEAAVRDRLCLVLDGDAIFLIARKPSLVKHYVQCVITPSLNEYRRFSHALGVSINKGDRAQKLQVRVLGRAARCLPQLCSP